MRKMMLRKTFISAALLMLSLSLFAQRTVTHYAKATLNATLNVLPSKSSPKVS